MGDEKWIMHRMMFYCRHFISENLTLVMWVLRDVNLSVKRGEIHALMGENGAGKSTLVKIITGVVKPNTGSVTYEGKPLNITHPSEIFDLGIGIVYQEFNLMPDLTVAQNILIGREPQSWFKGFLNERKTIQRAREVLEELECGIDPERKVEELSVAEQQMVEIAKSLSYNCRLLDYGRAYGGPDRK